MKFKFLKTLFIASACFALASCGTDASSSSSSEESLPPVLPPSITETVTESSSENTSDATSSETENSNFETSLDINVDETDVHYLVFIVNGDTIDKMVTQMGDTYEELQPFFPLIRVEGYTGTWPKIDKVWDAEKLEIELVARLSRI